MNRLLKSIYDSQLPFLDRLPVERTYKCIVEEAISLSDMDEGSLFLKSKSNLKRVYSSSPEFYDIQIRKGGMTYKGFKAKKPHVVHMHSSQKIHPHLREIGIKSIVVIPLLYKDKTIGVLSLYGKKKRKFLKNQIARLQLFAAFATITLQKAQLYTQIEQAMSVRDVFIAAASHELRTPLTSINGNIEILKNKSKKSSDSNIVDDLYRESTRLKRIIQKLDEANKIRSNNIDYNLREYTIDNIIGESVKVFQFFYNDHEIEAEQQDKWKRIFCIVDFEKLSLAFFNILENAAKYSAKNRKITIKSELVDSHVIISIADSGSGMSKDKIDSILYDNTSDLKKNGESLGLGLYLTKNIVERHRGTLSIDSKENSGTTVNINLPIHHLN